MKIFIKKISFLLLSSALLFGACDTEESIEITPPEAVFELQTPNINNIFLNFSLPDNPAFTISWNDDITGSTSYTIEMSSDAEFITPVTLGTSETNIFSMSVMDFNDALKAQGILSYEDVAIFMRVVTGSSTTNSVLFFVTTYAVEAPVITNLDNTFSLSLTDVDPEAVAMTVEFNDPEVGENNTASITYEVQIAEAGTTFAQPFSLGSTTELSLETTHGSLNEGVLSLGGTADVAGSFDIRIIATVSTASGNLIRTSDAVTITITPYSIELPPILYGVGAAIVGTGWGWTTPLELALQGAKYSGNIELANDAFRFFTVRDDWGSGQNFPYYVARGYTIDSNFEDALDGDNNFRFTGTPGMYSIVIDTDSETITLGDPIVGPNCNFDQLWGVGAAIVGTGWGWTNPKRFRCTGTGTYEGNVEFTNDAFRFFTTRDDWGSGRNYPYFINEGYTIDSNFEDALDGDNNFRFAGTPDTYFLSIDTVNKTIALEPEKNECEFPQLWGVGAAIVGTGWGWTNPLQVSCIGKDLYQSSVELQNGEAFRFFTTRDDWGSGRNYPYFTNEGYTIDANFEDALDGDNNFRFIGVSNTYTLTIDAIAKTITIE